MIDLSTLTDEQLDELRIEVLTAHERRKRLESTPAQSDALARAFKEAGGDVRHLPVVAQAQAEVRDVLWRTHPEFKPEFDTSVEDEATGLYPPYRQPAGAHDCYPLGARVSADGKNYASLHPANVWHPTTQHPGLWREVPTAEFEPLPDEPAAPAWEVGKAYVIGDLAVYNGVTYKVIQAHTSAAHWPPDAVASLYTAQ